MWEDSRGASLPKIQLSIAAPPVPFRPTLDPCILQRRKEIGSVTLDHNRLIRLQRQVQAHEKMGLVLSEMVASMADIPEARERFSHFAPMFDKALDELEAAMGWKEYSNEPKNLRNFQ